MYSSPNNEVDHNKNDGNRDEEMSLDEDDGLKSTQQETAKELENLQRPRTNKRPTESEQMAEYDRIRAEVNMIIQIDRRK